MNRERASDAKPLAVSGQDAAAFRLLYDRYATRIQRYFIRRCRDEEAALDLLAETVAGIPDPSTTAPALAPTIEVQLGSDGTGWGHIPEPGNTGVREVAHLTSCSAWSAR